MTTLREIENLGVSLQDNVCVFCSRTMDRWDSICGNCKDYKGVMNVVSAVAYYGLDILGNQMSDPHATIQKLNERKTK